MGKYYELPEYLQTISIQDLKTENEETQIEVMRNWFYQNYQDPLHECPYISAEGGYQYIHGGPYTASEELFSEFGEFIDEETINKLAEDLDDECIEWSGISKFEDYDDYLQDFIGSSEDPFKNFKESLDNLKAMLSVELNSAQQQTFFNMIFVNVITALEAYLSEFFIGQIEREEFKLRNFVKNNQDFKKEKFTLSEIFERKESLEDYVKKYLIDLLWHNLPKIKPMFKTTLNIDFPESMGVLVKAIHIRHDLIHRAGKSKDGTEIKLSKDDVSNLIEDVFKFCEHIENSNQFDPDLEF